MEETQKSAVEFAVEKLEKFIPSGNQIAIDCVLEQGKEMEEEQIIEFAKKCLQKALESDILMAYNQVEQYYNETFKNKNNER
jgi:hypothetical protein